MFTFQALFLLALASTQNPVPAPRPDQPQRPASPAEAAPVRDTHAPRAVDPDVEAWAALLVARLADRNPDVARSAEAGLVALGELAVPSVTRVAQSGSEEGVRAAQRVLERIRHRPPFHPPFRPGEGPLGRGPNGPGGPDDPRGRPLPSGPRDGAEPLPPPGTGPHGARRPDDRDGFGPRGRPLPPPDGGDGRRLPPPPERRGPGARDGRPLGAPRDGGPERGGAPPNPPSHRDGPI